MITLLLGINIIIKFTARTTVKSDQRVTTVVGLGGETDLTVLRNILYVVSLRQRVRLSSVYNTCIKLPSMATQPTSCRTTYQSETRSLWSAVQRTAGPTGHRAAGNGVRCVTASGGCRSGPVAAAGHGPQNGPTCMRSWPGILARSSNRRACTSDRRSSLSSLADCRRHRSTPVHCIRPLRSDCNRIILGS